MTRPDVEPEVLEEKKKRKKKKKSSKRKKAGTESSKETSLACRSGQTREDRGR